jgi:hypothetical protein
MYNMRRIFKRKNTSQFEVKDLLEFIFLGELISTGQYLYIVSPWISNIPILDNSLGQFSYLDPNWPKSKIRLKDVLIRLMNQGQKVHIVYLNKDKSLDQNEYDSTSIFISDLKDTSSNYGLDDKLHVKHTPNLHTKGLLTEKNFLSGSMNFTYNGLDFWDESITFETNLESISNDKY